MNWLDRLPFPLLIGAAIFIGLAPFVPEPHLLEKIRMLIRGELTRPLDIFDLAFHALPVLLLVLRLIRLAASTDTQ